MLLIEGNLDPAGWPGGMPFSRNGAKSLMGRFLVPFHWRRAPITSMHWRREVYQDLSPFSLVWNGGHHLPSRIQIGELQLQTSPPASTIWLAPAKAQREKAVRRIKPRRRRKKLNHLYKRCCIVLFDIKWLFSWKSEVRDEEKKQMRFVIKRSTKNICNRNKPLHLCMGNNQQRTTNFVTQMNKLRSICKWLLPWRTNHTWSVNGKEPQTARKLYIKPL